MADEKPKEPDTVTETEAPYEPEPEPVVRGLISRLKDSGEHAINDLSQQLLENPTFLIQVDHDACPFRGDHPPNDDAVCRTRSRVACPCRRLPARRVRGSTGPRNGDRNAWRREESPRRRGLCSHLQACSHPARALPALRNAPPDEEKAETVRALAEGFTVDFCGRDALVNVRCPGAAADPA